MTDPEVSEWLTLYRQGDVDALGRIVEFYRRPLFGFILRMAPQGHDAEEIFQEVWLRAIRHLDRYREKRFLSWLFSIAHHIVIDRVRKKKPETLWPDKNDDSTPWEERLRDTGIGPAETVASRELGHRIHAAVQSLPDDQREVFLLRMEADLSFKEIARIQGCRLNTALGRMHYAVAKLRDLLQEDYKQIGRHGS